MEQPQTNLDAAFQKRRDSWARIIATGNQAFEQLEPGEDFVEEPEHGIVGFVGKDFGPFQLPQPVDFPGVVDGFFQQAEDLLAATALAAQPQWLSNDWQWTYQNGLPWQFGTGTDGSTVVTTPRQDATFIGARYVYKFQ